MNDYSVFADRERTGWTDQDTVNAYVDKFGPITDQAASHLLDLIQVRGLDALDICCGHGVLTAMLADRGARATGLDFSGEMISIARDSAPQARFQQGDAGDLPFDDAGFDLVTCGFGMMHLPDQNGALSEISRVLRPGGTFAMATWSTPEDSPAFEAVFQAIRASADFSSVPAQPDLFTFARTEDARALIEGSGLTVQNRSQAIFHWVLSDPGELFEIFHDATVAAALLIKSQAPQTIETIRNQISETVSGKFMTDDGIRVPVGVSFIQAVK